MFCHFFPLLVEEDVSEDLFRAFTGPTYHRCSGCLLLWNKFPKVSLKLCKLRPKTTKTLLGARAAEDRPTPQRPKDQNLSRTSARAVSLLGRACFFKVRVVELLLQGIGGATG